MIEITKRDVIFLGILFVAASAFTIVFMAITGNMPQRYDDIVVEWTAMVRSNKSAEIFNLRFIIFAGIAALLCWFKFRKQTALVHEQEAFNANVEPVVFLCAILIFEYLFFQRISAIIVLALLFAVTAFLLDKKLLVPTVCCFLLNYYAVFALYHAFNFLGAYKIFPMFSNLRNVSASAAIVFASIFTGIPLLFKKRDLLLKKYILCVQLIIPALFLILSLKKYNDHGNEIIIGIPFAAKCFVAFMILSCFFCALVQWRKNWNADNADISGILSIGTCVSIMCFNLFHGQGAIMSEDFHHPFENIFAFQQIFELGQIPYKDFIPPSGLFSVVHGAFFKLFGEGNAAYYALSENIYYMAIFAATLFLLQFHVNKIWCFAVAVFLQIPVSINNNRAVFIALIVLLLTLPRLIKRRSLWLQLFLLASVFHGLYYPVFGAAVFVGFIPLFIMQAKKFVAEFKENKKSAKFWLSWIVTIALLAASIPLLWGTFTHIKAMSSQSVLADSIAIFGQSLPDWFMPYARDIFRRAVYNVIHVVPLALMIWLPALFFAKMMPAKHKKNFIKDNIEQVTLCLSLMLIPLVSYTYTFVRMDVNTLFARSWPMFAGVLIIYAVFLPKYVKGGSSRSVVTVLLTAIIVISWGVGVENIESKMISSYNVPDGYRYASSYNELKTLKNSFLSDGIINSLNYEKTKLPEINGGPSFAKLPQFGYWYVFEQKGGANLEAGTVKGFNAATETKNMLIEKAISCGSMLNHLGNYYLFNWLVSSGDYIWSEERRSFIPNDADSSWQKIKSANSRCPLFLENYDLGNSADVFGLSYKSLEKIFSKQEVEYEIQNGGGYASITFDAPVAGKDVDFVYVELSGIENEYIATEFDMGGEHERSQSRLITKLFLKKKANPNAKACLSFYDEDGAKHSVQCNYGNGRLLINVGTGYKYLLNSHSLLEISVLKNGEEIAVPDISKIEFLKCRQIFEERSDYK